jgi:ABC-type sugar transport system permease subunit
MSIALAAPAPAQTAQRTLALLLFWRLIFGVLALAAAVAFWMLPALTDLRDWMQITGSVVLGLAGVFSLLAVPDIRARRHRGRVISLVIDYLGFVAALIGFLQVTGSFLFVGSMADFFGRGLLFLGIAFIGYLISSVGDRYENAPRTQRAWRRAGYAVMALGFVLFLVAVNTPRGLLYLLRQLADPAALTLLVLAAVFGVALWAMWRQPTAEAMHAKTGHEEMLNGWLFLSPNLLGFLIFFAGPLLLSLYFSFTNSDAFNPPDWVGLANYARLLNVTVAPLASPAQAANQALNIQVYDELFRFTIFGNSWVVGAQDKLFWISLRNTLVFALLAVPLSVIPALLLANILNSSLPGMKFFRAVYFLPSIAAIVGIALVWQWLYNSTIGYINYFITLGVDTINTLFGASIADPRIQWLSDRRTALLAVIVMAAWQTVGFNTVLFLAGLQNIPKVLYEAATVDGAGAWAKFWKVTLPLLAPTTFFVLITTSIQAMQVFEQVYILINPPEGPGNSTVTMVLYLYRSGFQNFRQGYASAIAWVLFVLIFGLTLLQFRRQRAGTDYD